MIIALVGMPGAGKSVASAHLKDKGYPILRFGDQTDIGLKEQGLPLTPENEKKYRETLRAELGMKAYAVKIEPRILEALKSATTVVLDGLYSWEEYTYLKSQFPDLVLLAIYATPKLRYQRLSTREIRPLTADQARQRDIAELENLNKGGPIAFADYLITNNASKDELSSQIDQALSFFGIKA